MFNAGEQSLIMSTTLWLIEFLEHSKETRNKMAPNVYPAIDYMEEIDWRRAQSLVGEAKRVFEGDLTSMYIDKIWVEERILDEMVSTAKTNNIQIREGFFMPVYLRVIPVMYLALELLDNPDLFKKHLGQYKEISFSEFKKPNISEPEMFPEEARKGKKKKKEKKPKAEKEPPPPPDILNIADIKDKTRKSIKQITNGLESKMEYLLTRIERSKTVIGTYEKGPFLRCKFYYIPPEGRSKYLTSFLLGRIPKEWAGWVTYQRGKISDLLGIVETKIPVYKAPTAPAEEMKIPDPNYLKYYVPNEIIFYNGSYYRRPGVPIRWSAPAPTPPVYKPPTPTPPAPTPPAPPTPPATGTYISNPDWLKYYVESELVRIGANIYLKPGIPIRWTTAPTPTPPPATPPPATVSVWPTGTGTRIYAWARNHIGQRMSISADTIEDAKRVALNFGWTVIIAQWDSWPPMISLREE